jgi:hypothetical protein
MTYMDNFMYYLQENWAAIPLVALLLFFLGGILFSKKKEDSYEKVSYDSDMFRDDLTNSRINPATGMNMTGLGLVDTGGNLYGFGGGSKD